ncbi:unnamed protein product, partial [Pocillopora meandrina]
YRKTKSVDLDGLKQDIAKSRLCCPSSCEDFDKFVQSYNYTLSSILDRHAPLKSKVMRSRPQVPWYSQEIAEAKREERRKAERRWRLSKLYYNLAVFKVKRNAVYNLMNKARQAFYAKLIEDNSCNQRKLFRVSKRLFNQSQGDELPLNLHAHTFANEVGKYFVSKI